jgi:tRNA(Ile)-lysidine synthase
MRVLRGSGLQGLSGIWPVRKYNNIVLIRPLLNISKKDILRFLKASNESYCIDSTNRTGDYLRNKIRLKTIPYLKRHFNSQLEDIFCREATILREAYHYIRKEAYRLYLKLVSKKKDAISINLNKLKNLPNAVVCEILRMMILESKGNLKDISYDNLQDILCLSQSRCGSKILYVDNDIKIVREYSKLSMIKLKARAKGHKIKLAKTIKINGGTQFKDLDCRISTKVLKAGAVKVTKKYPFKEYIDVHKIKNKLAVRVRKSGDRFKPLGLKRKKSLKKFFIDMKIPAAQRDFIPLIVDADQIVWVAGIRLSEDYRVTNATKQILELKISYH